MIQYVFTQYLKAINTKKTQMTMDDTFAPKYISIKCPKNIIYMLTEIKTNWGDLNNGNFTNLIQNCKNKLELKQFFGKVCKNARDAEVTKKNALN